MRNDIEKQLLDEIVRRDKELCKLKDAYEVLSGSKFVGIGTISVELTSGPEVGKEKKERAAIGTPEFKEAISKGMKKSWKRRKAKKGEKAKVSKFEKPGYVPKYETQAERSEAQSKKMTEYWANRRKDDLGKRGLPAVIKTHHEPVETTPVGVVGEPVAVGESGQRVRDGRFDFLPPVGVVRKNRIWSPEEDEVLELMWGRLSSSEIANRLRRSVNNVEKRHARLGRESQVKDILGTKFRKSYGESRKKGLTATKRWWSPSEDGKLLELAELGMNSEQISKELKRPVNGVKLRYSKISGEGTVLPADRKRKKKEKSRSSLSKFRLIGRK